MRGAVIVNRSFVERFVRDRNPIGRRVRYLCTGENCSAPAAEPGPWHEIVGVVDDVRLTISADLSHNAGLYHPIAPGEAPELNLIMQVRGEPEDFAPRLRAVIADVDPALRLYYIRSLDENSLGPADELPLLAPGRLRRKPDRLVSCPRGARCESSRRWR